MLLQLKTVWLIGVVTLLWVGIAKSAIAFGFLLRRYCPQVNV